MRNIIMVIAVAAFALAAYDAKADEPKARKDSGTETVVYDVSINCENCKAKLEKHIPFEKGVRDMEVDIPAKQVTVKFDTKKNSSEGIAEAIRKLGYTCTVADPDEDEE